MALDRKAQLLKDFDEVVAPQKLVLAGKLPELFSRYYAPPPGLPVPQRAQAGAGAAGGLVAASKGSKRPGMPGGGGDSKRARPGQPLNEWDRQVEEMLKEVKMMINRKLWSKKEISAFKEPVDPIRLNIPDYHNYIKHPMDVGTVRKKLDQGVYKSPLEVRDDLRLVWRNCATYNPPGTPVRNMGDILAAAWEAVWAESNMEQRWNEFCLQRDPKVGCGCGPTQLSGARSLTRACSTYSIGTDV